MHLTRSKTRLSGISTALILVCFSSVLLAQTNSITIGGTGVNGKAVLWLVPNGTGQGLLLPGVSTSVRNGMGLSTSENGMIVYDNVDNKVYLWNSPSWIDLMGSTAGSTTVTLTGDVTGLSSNTLVTALQGKKISTAIPTAGQFLQWNGTSSQWEPGTPSTSTTSYKAGAGIIIATDNTISIPAGGVTDSQISGVAPAKLSSAGATANQVLQWNGTAWVPAAVITTLPNSGILINGSQISVDAGTAASKIVQLDLTGKLPAIDGSQLTNLPAAGGGPPTGAAGGDLTGTYPNPTIAANSVDDSNITGVGPAKITQGGATTGQVLTWTGSAWAAQTTAGGSPTGAAGGDLTGVYPNPTLAANSVDDSNITAVGPAKITQSGATTGQVLTWTGSAWAAQTTAGGSPTGAANGDLSGTYPGPLVQGLQGRPISTSVPLTNSVYQYDGTSWVPAVLSGGGTVSSVATSGGLTGGPITSSGTISILNGGVNTAQLASAAVTNLNIAASAVNSSQIIDGTIADIDLASGISVAKLTPGTNGQVLTTAAGATSWQAPAGLTNPMTTAGDLIVGGAGGVPQRLGAGTNGFVFTIVAGSPNWAAAPGGLSSTLPSTDIFVGNGSNVATGVALSGDATISNSGVLTIAPGAITDAKVNASGINGSKVIPAFGAQPISTTGTLAAGAATITGLTVSGASTKINSVTYAWPGGQGAASTVLTNNGSGTLTWAAAAGLSSTLGSGQIFVGNGSNVATGVTMSGDATLSNSGVISLGAGVVNDAQVGSITTAGKVSGSAITGTIGGSVDINTSGAITSSGTISASSVVATTGSFNGTLFGHTLESCSSTINVIFCPSDQRFKKNIVTLSNSLSNIISMRGVSYDWRKDEFPKRYFNDKKQMGFIAQELEKIYPEAVTTNDDGYKSVEYIKIIPVLVEAMKEQQVMIDLQQEKIGKIEAMANELKSQMSQRDRRIADLEASSKANESAAGEIQIMKEELEKIKQALGVGEHVSASKK